jgi:hypothetical protein
VCLAAHLSEFLDGLPQMSNCYCHPGRAGGTPHRLVTADGDVVVRAIGRHPLRVSRTQVLCSFAPANSATKVRSACLHFPVCRDVGVEHHVHGAPVTVGHVGKRPTFGDTCPLRGLNDSTATHPAPATIHPIGKKIRPVRREKAQSARAEWKR